MSDRTIKFNAWDEKARRMHLWNDIEAIERDRIWLRGSKLFVFKAKLLQFTGCKDIDGKEIYFKDIIEDKYKHKHLVLYDIETGRYYLKAINSLEGNLDFRYATRMTRIGNIYEHKEKIKDEAA